MSCLDVPVPDCIRRQARKSPFRFLTRGDCVALDLIREFGAEFDRPANEIHKACMLASGYWDLIVILERPRKSHPYNASFRDFVQNCDTLKAVDELIQFASKGSRSIHTVTVLDAFSFSPPKPSESGSLPTLRCYELAENIIKHKGPKVVLCCWSDKSGESSLLSHKFMSQGVGTWPPCEKIAIEGTDVLAIRSFHPATAVCYRKYSPCTRMILIYHFVLAFGYLSDSGRSFGNYPQWAEYISQKKSGVGKPRPTNLRLSLTSKSSEKCDSRLQSIEQAIKKVECIPETLVNDIAAQHLSEPSLQQIRDLNPEDQLNFFLQRLCSKNYAGGALPLVKLCLVLKQSKHAKKEKMTPLLYTIGSHLASLQTEPSIKLLTVAGAAHSVVNQPSQDDLVEKLERLTMSKSYLR
ncbi:uncharacterized protein PG998_014297 [Apiospora kogelbergensis]|uniref:uncharacterized protein n=1 Tax=Apiospora kogelbergensis TaxID=1337665 RepID=UPI00312DF45A